MHRAALQTHLHPEERPLQLVAGVDPRVRLVRRGDACGGAVPEPSQPTHSADKGCTLWAPAHIVYTIYVRSCGSDRACIICFVHTQEVREFRVAGHAHLTARAGRTGGHSAAFTSPRPYLTQLRQDGPSSTEATGRRVLRRGRVAGRAHLEKQQALGPELEEGLDPGVPGLVHLAWGDHGHGRSGNYTASRSLFPSE